MVLIFAAGQPEPPGPLRTVRLHERVTVLEGDGGNMALIAPRADEGVVLIDTGFVERVDDLMRALTEHAPEAVRTVVNTHWHVDHVGGNVALGQAGAAIVAHENCRKRLSETVTVAAMNDRVFPPLAYEGRPVRTFTRRETLVSGAGTVELIHVPEAHTDGDCFAFLPEANILQAGDLYWNGFYPLIDYSTQGWIGGMAEAGRRMLAQCDAQTRVIPGHGPVSGRAELEHFTTMLATVHERLAKLIREGKTEPEVVAAAPTREFDATFPQGVPPAAFVANAYRSLLARRSLVAVP